MRASSFLILVIAAFVGISVTSADEGMHAVDIQIRDPEGNALFLEPGERVDVYVTRMGEPGIFPLLWNVKVLGPLDQKRNWSNSPLAPKTLTVELNAADRQKVALMDKELTLLIFLRDDTLASQRRKSANQLPHVYVPSLVWDPLLGMGSPPDFPRFCIPPFAALPRFCIPTRADDPRIHLRGDFPDRV